MAFPTILIDSASGSDSAASGAGPATALSGATNASTDATGLVVTLPSGTVLTGVSTTGSHAIYLADSTAGARNFGKITATSGSGGATPTVTVSDAFGVSLSARSWAIGGKRASVDGTASRKLRDNNGGAGDAMPGWAIEMQSGHVESCSGQLDFRRGGSTTDGRITFRGAPGAATLPMLTMTGGTLGLVPRSSGWLFQDFELRSTVGGAVIWSGAASQIKYVGLVANHATNHFTDGFQLSSGSECFGCRVGRMTNDGISLASDGSSAVGCTVDSCGRYGITSTADVLSGLVAFNTVVGNTSHAIYFTGSNTTQNRRVIVVGNTVDGNSGDGIRIDGAGAMASCSVVMDNIVSSNGGYGITYPNASCTTGFLLTNGAQVRNNNTYLNTSGQYHDASGTYASNACPWASGDPGANPTFAGSGDYTPGNAALQAGYP